MKALTEAIWSISMGAKAIIAIVVVAGAAAGGAYYYWTNQTTENPETEPAPAVQAADPAIETDGGAEDIEDAFAEEPVADAEEPVIDEMIDESLEEMIEGVETTDAVDTADEFVDVYETTDAFEPEAPTAEDLGSGHGSESAPEPSEDAPTANDPPQ